MGKVKSIILTSTGIIGSICLGCLISKNASSKTLTDTAAQVVSETEKMFGGIPLSKLNEIAKAIHPKNWLEIDQWGFLVLHYPSNRGRQSYQTQMKIDNSMKLVDMNCGPVFDGQLYSHARAFVKKVNDLITFTQLEA